MIPSIQSLLALSLSVLSFAQAQTVTPPQDLVGTWTSKSKAVLTGPGFYDPISDRIIEPPLTGISYSFTQDGFYEEAYYRAIPNPTTPSCPSSIMQWQHGTYQVAANGSMLLTPIPDDGRQVMSSPCSYDDSIYTRYNQPELMKGFEVILDPYHNVQRLNLFKFDGSPIMPLYLEKSPPQMLPTTTLNPTVTATSGAAGATGKSKVKRTADGQLSQRTLKDVVNNPAAILPPIKDLANPDKWWWAGVGFIAVGTVLYMWPTSV